MCGMPDADTSSDTFSAVQVVIKMNLTDLFRHHFLSFNARSLKQAAEVLRKHVDEGGAVVVAIGGALSTAGLGTSLSRLIRAQKVHAISCTGANLEEDFFRAVGRSSYVNVDFRNLSGDDEEKLHDEGLRRITDTCVPESVMTKVGSFVTDAWRKADAGGHAKFPHEFVYEAIRDHRGDLEAPADSWVLAAAECSLPMFVPGWEDSTLGNTYAALVRKGVIANAHTVKGGIEYMLCLAEWYERAAKDAAVALVQLGGGIAGDFVICVVPMLREELRVDVRPWAYFCQIRDSTTSYGSYSGAPPNEKISWGKIGPETPAFDIESDATIVAPLLFEYLLEKDR